MTTCVGCGAELAPGALICGECGRAVSSKAPKPQRRVIEPEPAPQPPVEVPPVPKRPVVPRPPAGDPHDRPAAGAPAAPEFAAPAPAPEFAAPPPPPAPEPPRAAERFVLQFSTGESFTVTGTGLVGRNPRPEPGEYFDHTVTIADPGKSVSKTHLEFGQDEGVFWISDRFSGNGTFTRDPEQPPHRCEPGRRYRVARGGRVDIGDQFFIVS